MTEQRLRELLRESVSHESGPDLADAAWEQARRSRRRSRVAVVAGSVAAVVVISGGVAVLERPEPKPVPGTADASPPAGSADADLDGTPVWWAPTGDAEAGLPAVDRTLTRLPAQIDLSADAPDIAKSPMTRALAAFAVLDDFGLQRLLLLGADGTYRTLDVSALDPVAKPNGYLLPPESASMLSPDGRTLLFPQDGHLELYDLADNGWRRIDTGKHATAFATWDAAGQIHLPRSSPYSSGPLYDVAGDPVGSAGLYPPSKGIPLGQAAPFGRMQTNATYSVAAQSWSAGARAPVPSGGYSDPELLVVTPGVERSLILAFPESSEQPIRWKQCCPAAGWLDDDTVVYESRKAVPQLIAWRIGTPEFHTVTTITGFTPGQEAYVASWADLEGAK